jgi:Na+/proline symporter
MGLSYLFDSILGIPYYYCMIFIAVLTAVYVFLGGYTATVWSDLVQGIIMLTSVFFMVFYVAKSDAVGGFANIIPKLEQISENAAQPLASVFGGKKWLGLLSLVMLTSLGSMGLPQMIHKFYAVKNQAAVKSATVITTAFTLIIGVGAYFTGALSRIIVNSNPGLWNYIWDGSKIQYDNIMPVILKSTLPSLVLGVIGILVLSASMSTLSSLVLTSASAIAIDLFDEKTKFNQKKKLPFFRILCLAFVLLSFIIAVLKPAYIVTLMSFSWGTVSGTFIGPYIWGLYSKRITKAGVYAGFLGGFLTSIILTLGSGFNQANAPMFGTIAMLVSFVLTPLVSLFTRQYSPEFIKKVFVVEEKEG